MWLRKMMLRGSIDGGESCREYAEILPDPILDDLGGEREYQLWGVPSTGIMRTYGGRRELCPEC